MPDGSRIGAPPVRADVLTIPNAISLARICAVPATVWLVLHGHSLLAFALFAGAGISDGIDGWLARREGPTRIGMLLDPLADKALVVSAYVTLAAVGEVRDWLAMLVVFRDVMIVGGVLVLTVLDQRVEIRPLLLSKANTVLQIGLIALALLRAGSVAVPPMVIDVLTALVAASTLASGGAYALQVARGSAG
ncbi:MAG: CDP-alcohol phosphatidyltransferase family protein [Rhodospirillales bacterium]|nr:CDP-alcohol phosphatidyltransferase family protein [Rhodospirillales bacterium]